MPKSMTTATRIIEWDAGHRVVGHESKCARIHGHRYRAEIGLRADALDSVGRVIDFGVVKEVIGGWVDDCWDHRLMLWHEDPLCELFRRHRDDIGVIGSIVEVPSNPTAENLARVLMDVADGLLERQGFRAVVRTIRLYETPNCYVDVCSDHG